MRLQMCTTASGLKLFRAGGPFPQGHARRPAVLHNIRQRNQLLTYAASQSTGEVKAKTELAVRSCVTQAFQTLVHLFVGIDGSAA